MSHNHSIFYINAKKSTASEELSHLLEKCIEKIEHPWEEIVFVCIGSDRINGDSLGPFIGHQLERFHWDSVYVYGTLHAPIHALNLEDTMRELKDRHPSAIFVAVDASLGAKKHIGFITIGMGPICPGAGVNKELLPVGDIFITGILNESGCFEHLLLQTTRLSFVVEMAETITNGISQVFSKTMVTPKILPPIWTFSDDDTKEEFSDAYAALSIESISGESF